MSRNRAVSLLLVALFLWVTGCTSYTQIELGEVADHGKVRVTLVDGERETLRDPLVEADSIKGQVNEGAGRAEWAARAIPVDQVVELEAAETNTASTVLVVLGAVVVVGVVVGALTYCSTYKC